MITDIGTTRVVGGKLMIKIVKKIWVKIIKKFWNSLVNNKQHSKIKVKIDSWGGTSVDPSEVFRSEQGKKDLDFFVELAKRKK
jgi:hypothetical protein